jgi:hypothetical protein
MVEEIHYCEKAVDSNTHNAQNYVNEPPQPSFDPP